MHTGWFEFHRQIFDNPICTKDSEYFFVWCYLLTEASYEEQRVIFKNEEIILKKGQFLTTIKDIASRLNIDESKVNRILKKLEIEKQIEKQTSNKNTVITILNWEKYQSDEKQNDKPVTNECKTNDNQMTNECKTNAKPSYYIKEIKKEINKESKNIVQKDVYYPNDELLNEAFKEFLSMRNKIKKPISTKQALTRMVNKIDKLSGGDNNLAVKILNQSVDHCWQDVYELKENNSDRQGFGNGIDWSKV